MRLASCLAALAVLAPGLSAAARDGTLWTPVMKSDAATVGMDRAPAVPQPDGSLETRVMIVLRAPQAAEEGIYQYILGRYRTDCAGRRTAVMVGRLFDAEGREIASQTRETPQWLPVEEGTPNAEIVAVLCDGRPMPDGPVWDTAAFVAATRDPDAPTPVWPRQPLPPPVAVTPVR